MQKLYLVQTLWNKLNDLLLIFNVLNIQIAKKIKLFKFVYSAVATATYTG